MNLPPARRRPTLRRAALAATGAAAVVVALLVVLGPGSAGPSSGGAVAAGSSVASGGTAGTAPAGIRDGGSAGTAPTSPSLVPSGSVAVHGAGTSPSASPSPGASGPAAPTSAAGFRPRATVIAMGPLFRSGTAFAYGDAFAQPRDGIVYPYNLARGIGPNGRLLRAHDGQDLIVPIGTIVLAPFAGVVVDPAAIWRPWDPQRYGKVIVIRSTEATSAGYYAILVHLSRQSVPIGASVRRGQVVGRTGDSGNDRGLTPQLHFELRAPFPIRYGYGHVIRWVDCFDPLPSLKAAFAGA